MEKKILYIGNFSFPYGNAAGARVLGNGYLFKELGYEVVFIDLDENIAENIPLIQTKRVFDDFDCYSLPYPNSFRKRLAYRNSYNKVIDLINTENWDSIIIYGNPFLAPFVELIRKWTVRNQVKFLVDCADWWASGSGNYIFRFIKYLDTTYRLKVLNSRADGVIAISSYLSNYYEAKGCKTVVIPPLVNERKFKNLSINNENSNKVSLIYVGQPFPIGKGRSVNKSSYKDRLDIVIDVLGKLTNNKFIFNIYGISKEEYLSVIGAHEDLLNKLNKKVIFHGKIVNSTAIQQISKADFTILFRDNKKLTNAGFPTKFVETISCGTPIITTKTSDLMKFIEEGKNGYFVDMDDQDRLREQMKIILTLDKSQIRSMKSYCKNSNLFSYKNYTNGMRNFISSI